MDITAHLRARSNQLNADDLMGGPITVQIKGVEQGTAEQPVSVKLVGGHMPWKPSKTALRILAHCWGVETDAWVGRWVRLYRDDSVQFGGSEVGGIRPSALSHIDGAVTLNLAVSRGKKKGHRIALLKPAEMTGGVAPTANLDGLLRDEGLTRADVDRWRKATDKPALDTAPDKIPAFAAWLATHPDAMAAIKALKASAEQATSGSEDDDFERAHPE